MSFNTRQSCQWSSAICRALFNRQKFFAILFAILLGNTSLPAQNYKLPDYAAVAPWPTNIMPAKMATSNAQTVATHVAKISKPDVLKVDETNSMSILDNKYRLSLGDKLSFRIVEDEEDAKPLVVTDSGELEVPYLGRFPALGKTCFELAHALKAELEKDYYYQATVIVAVDVMTKSRGRVYLVGPVRSPGPQEVPNDEVLTLSKAILRAGGFTDYADRRKIKVTRKSSTDGAPEEVFTVNVEEVLEKGKIESDLPLRAGDLIYVPERLVRF